MNLLTDSFSVLVGHWQLTLGIAVGMLLSQAVLASALRLLFRDRLSAGDYFALAAGGWIFPLSLLSLLWLLGGSFLPPQAAAVLLLICASGLAIPVFRRRRSLITPGSKVILWALVALFGVFLFLRLAFVSEVIVPLYFDSAQHYRIADNLLQGFSSSAVPISSLQTSRYYHTGFHALTAWIAFILGAEVIDTILVLGQWIVAAIPLALFPIIRQETRSGAAGILAVLLAAIGWYMPAYAVNWGKYPAVTSLALLTFVTCLAYLSLRYREIFPAGKRLWLFALLGSGLFTTVLVHSRAIVVLAVFALAWSLAGAWQRLSGRLRFASIAGIVLGIVLVILHVRTRDVFGLLFDPYWEKGLFITAIVLFLSVFGVWHFPRLAVAAMLVILLLLGSLLVPVQVPGYGRLTLLDRPFVEMILYLPLSVLGAAGAAGLDLALRNLRTRWGRGMTGAGDLVSGLFILVLLINAFTGYNFYPAGCCDIVGRDDLVAIDWIDRNLPSEARILISSTELRVLDTDSPQGAAGGDAGAWITPLTGRVTIPLPYQSDFSQQTIFEAVCRSRAGYIYVGEAGTTFNNGSITTRPDRYKPALSMPGATVYQVTGCPGPQ